MAMSASRLSACHGLRLPTVFAVLLLIVTSASPGFAQPGRATPHPMACVERATTVSAASRPLTSVERGLIFEAIQAGGEPTEAPPSSFDDKTLVATVLRYAHTELGQCVRPSRVDRIWAIEPAPHDVASEFEGALTSGRLNEWLASLRVPHTGYRQLAVERCRYLSIIAAGGWGELAQGPPLKGGVESPLSGQLRLRLAQEGYVLSPSSTPNRFDDELARALRLFQERHGLLVDGDLGRQTRDALNVSAEARAGQIEANLERWRWLPHSLPSRRIEVDIARSEATLFNGGAPALNMRVVVGDPRHKTPMFTTQVAAVVFNPPWNVPSSIASNEILPRAARDPTYLARNGFDRRDGRLVQRPGPANALGRLKFDFPSPFGIYLHDTPNRAAFARPQRALSHGCVRLEKPRELAQALLVAQGWTLATIDAAIDAGTTRRVAVQAPIPLYLVYRTAFVDAAGNLNFRPDVYAWDAKLLAALAPFGAGSAAEVRLESECSAASEP